MPVQVFSYGVESGTFDVETELVTVEMGGVKKYVALPRLSGKGVGKVLRCELLKGPGHGETKKVPASYGQVKPEKGLIGVGDHVLVLGRVVEILDRDKTDGEKETKYGLSYVDGRYRRAGDIISPTDERPAEDRVEEGKNC